MKIDAVDLEIVRILSEDARASYSGIAKVVGVSVGTVRNRINHMRASQMLRFNVWLDPYRSGLGVNATLLLKVRAGELDEVIATLIALDETGYVATVAGDHDAQLDAFCRDIPHLSRFIHEKVQKIEGVTEVTTHLVTDIKYESSINLLGIIDQAE